MKSNNFNYSLLAIGVAAVLGISTGANAGTASGDTSNGGATINNQATASYNVAGVTQPTVISNTVTVNVTETASFSLFAINGASATDDKNENISITPVTNATFNHLLTNTGNVTDTYTINTTTTNDVAIDTATPNYTLPVSEDVVFTIQPVGGGTLSTAQQNALTALGQDITGTLTGSADSTRKIKLPPGLQAALSYTPTTLATRLGGDIGVGTLTATSTFINAATSTTKVPTLVNENQTIVRLPIFKIEKTATCTNAPCTTLDLTATTPKINYSIKVSNVDSNTTPKYSDTAINFIVRDVLPEGMTVDGAVTTTANPSNVSIRAVGTEGTRQVVEVLVNSLAVGANLDINFTVNVEKTKFNTANSSVTNHATVYDKFNDIAGATSPTSTSYDIVDSTDNVPANNATRVPAEGSGTVGEDTASTVKFSRRNLTLAEATTREIAPLTSTTNTNGQVTHVATITNNGQDIEGNTDNPLTLTITDGSNAEVNPVLSQFFLVYTSPNGGTPTQPYLVTPTQSGNVYTISSSTFPGNLGIEPGGKLEVRYNMESTAINGSPGTGATIGSIESTVVKLTADGINAPTIAAITDTTNVRGLTLDKFQALDANCDGNPTTAAVSKDLITGAKPDQCIIYRINATNTSSPIQNSNSAAASGFNITALEIKDLFSNFAAGANFVMGSATSSATPNSTIANPIVVTDTSVAATASTLAPQGVATLNFKVKIKNAR